MLVLGIWSLMITHHVKVHPSKAQLPKTEQLAWKIAAVATDKAAIDSAASEMVVNRIIDNASVALAAINRTPVANARTQALAHPRAKGAAIFGLSSAQRFDCEWAAWANGVAVREKRVVHVQLAHGDAVGPRGPLAIKSLR